MGSGRLRWIRSRLFCDGLVALAQMHCATASPHILDEASSAMDEGLEHAMYRLLREALPTATLISVGHRSSLLSFHTRGLELLGEGKWRLQEFPEAASSAA